MFLPSTKLSGFEFITVARFFIRLIEWVHDLRGDCSHFNFYGCSITQLHHIHKKEQFKLILLSSGSADTWIDAIMSHGERHPRRKPSLFLLVGCLMRARKEKRKPDYLIMPFQPATLTLLWKLFFRFFVVFFLLFFESFYLFGSDLSRRINTQESELEEKSTIQLIYDSVRGRWQALEVPKVEQRRRRQAESDFLVRFMRSHMTWWWMYFSIRKRIHGKTF